MRKAWWAFLGLASVGAVGCGGAVSGATPAQATRRGDHDGGAPMGAGGAPGAGRSGPTAVAPGSGGDELGTGGISLSTGGRPETGAAGTDADISFDAGSGIDITYDGGTPTARACEHHFAATYLLPCGGPVLPHAELQRIHALYMRSCTGLALPGLGTTAAELETCAADLEANACAVQLGMPSSCSFTGTLDTGAPCSDDAQCASGTCTKVDPCSPEGCTLAPACGTCAPVATVGEDCHTAVCGPNAVCDTVTHAGPGIYQCVPRSDGDLGAACDGIGKRCRPGLFCDHVTNECSQLGFRGAPCGDYWSIGCRPPLICEGTPGVCQDRRAVGANCYVDGECAEGLGCALGRCAAITWVQPGDACGGARRCLVGSCGAPRSLAPEICPRVVPDGKQCDQLTSTCDTFSECINGKCEPHGTVECAGP